MIERARQRSSVEALMAVLHGGGRLQILYPLGRHHICRLLHLS